MKLCLDTNAYSDWRKSGMWNEWISQADEILMPVIVLGELRTGFSLGRRGVENERRLSDFLDLPLVEIGVLSESTSVHYAVMKKYLQDQGAPMPTNDVWIAACAVEHGAILLTRDSHFKKLPQVRVMWPEG